jgi:hypothetical protein
MESLGKINYQGYRLAAAGRSLVSGAELPEWDDLPSEIQGAWEAAADAVATEVRGQS